MSMFEMQPTFWLEVSVPVEEAHERIRGAVRSLRDPNTIAAGSCIDFKVDPRERRFWSPHLSVQISDAESGCRFHCRFSPRPEIWTMVMAIYGIAFCFGAAAAIYAYVQWFLGWRPWALVIVLACTAIILGLHFASLIGQSWSADQMARLRRRLDDLIQSALGQTPIEAIASDVTVGAERSHDSCAEPDSA